MADWRIDGAHEWIAHDPFGRAKAEDACDALAGGAIRLRVARGAYASFRVLVRGAGRYRLAAAIDDLEVDLAKAWYHRLERDGVMRWLPDALIPLAAAGELALPDPANAIPGQTTQEFWVDCWAPRDAKPGERRGAIVLGADGGEHRLPFAVEVLARELPAEPSVVMDKNSYGCRWLERQYPAAYRGSSDAQRWTRMIGHLHAYHRLFHEHRGCFHNLGHGHSGGFDPIYGPRAEGVGRERRLAGWEGFDALYGPLLDGSCFARPAPGQPRARRGATPIWGVYSPLNPDFPARYVNWGEEGYRVEFRRCVAEFDRHLRERGWTRSAVELFLNHKKRYRWFGWDGDEAKYRKDNPYHVEMASLLHTTVSGSPVRWTYRMDASWQMRDQFDALAGHVDMWVLNSFAAWYRDEVARVVARGDTVFWYGGTPRLDEPSSNALQPLYLTWARGLAGYLPWLSIDPGADPWFASDGGGTASVYPGERFGIDGPIASIRLKIERNGIQDVDLLRGDDGARAALAARVPLRAWGEPPMAARMLPPEEWDDINLQTGIEPGANALERVDPGWWSAVRERALGEGAT